MRLVTIAAALVLGLSLVACGGEEAGAPMALEERVVGAAEAPGSEPDPVETPVTATGLEELEAELAGPNVYEEDLRAVEEAGGQNTPAGGQGRPRLAHRIVERRNA